ncbi:hypothetical protein VPH35_130716 [Triticum aestivum]
MVSPNFLGCCSCVHGVPEKQGGLIKNPGGIIVPCGGYVAGKKDLVAAATTRLSAPGLGVEFGSAPCHVMRAMFQGLFLAPQMVGEAVKGGLLIAEVMSAKGYRVQRLPRAPRHDIVQVDLSSSLICLKKYLALIY